MPSDNFSVASNRTIFLTDIFLTVVNFSLVPNHVSPPKKEECTLIFRLLSVQDQRIKKWRNNPILYKLKKKTTTHS